VSVTVVEDSSAAVLAPGAAQPRQLIVSLYGLYTRQNNGWLSVAAAVRLMAELGVDGQAVRSSLSRLKRRGLLVARRLDGAAGYEPSPVALDILSDGDARIFGRRRATTADGWLLVIFSVPESERDKRHQLRAQLTHLGSGRSRRVCGLRRDISRPRRTSCWSGSRSRLTRSCSAASTWRSERDGDTEVLTPAVPAADLLHGAPVRGHFPASAGWPSASIAVMRQPASVDTSSNCITRSAS
jgi:hypothetical protein